MLVHSDTRSVTKAANAWPADASAAVILPVGIGLASVAFRLSGTLAGSTVTGSLQGSIDGTNFEAVPDGSSGGLAAATAAGAAVFGGGADKLIDLSPYRYVRLVVTETADADDGAIMAASILAYYGD